MDSNKTESTLPDAAGFILGLTVPVLVGWLVLMLTQLLPYCMYFGFYSCLLTAGVLAGIGGRNWERSGFWRGLTAGAGAVLFFVMMIAGDILQ